MKIIENLESYREHYSESKLMDKIRKFATSAGQKVVYAALLGFYVLRSDEVPFADKAKIYGALGYFILPVDLIPDAIPVMGFTDDFAALMFVLNAVKASITPRIRRQAMDQLTEWFGEIDEDELETLL